MKTDEVKWESISGDMTGEKTVGVQIVDDTEKPFRFIRRGSLQTEESEPEILGTFTKRELSFLRNQIDSAMNQLHTQQYQVD